MSISIELVQYIFDFFQLKEEILSVKAYWKGQLNYTFLITCTNNKRYILQKINTLFNIAWVMKNIDTIHNHLLKKQAEGLWDNGYDILTPIKNEAWKNYVEFENNSWRMYYYIENTLTQDYIYYSFQAEKVGELIGQFHLCLSDLEGKLYNPLPGFHNTPNYYKNFQEALLNTKISERDDQMEKWIKWKKSEIDYFFDLIDSKQIQTRTTHNDTKVNNILFDKNTWNPVVIIDWDTISNELPLWVDIGDMCRSMCSNTLEEWDDFVLVDFREDIFESLMKGYLKKGNGFLTEIEKKHIIFSIWFLIFELAMRYYTDYLNGNKYFLIRYPLQNLEKAKKTYFLWKSFESKKELLKKIVDKYI